jgi:hypothetical protein
MQTSGDDVCSTLADFAFSDTASACHAGVVEGAVPVKSPTPAVLVQTFQRAEVGPTWCTKRLAENPGTVPRLMAHNERSGLRVAIECRAFSSVVLERCTTAEVDLTAASNTRTRIAKVDVPDAAKKSGNRWAVNQTALVQFPG